LPLASFPSAGPPGSASIATRRSRPPAAPPLRLPAPALRGRPPLRLGGHRVTSRGSSRPAPALRGRPPLRRRARCGPAPVGSARQRRPSGVGLHCDLECFPWPSQRRQCQRRPSGVGLHCDMLMLLRSGQSKPGTQRRPSGVGLHCDGRMSSIDGPPR